MILGVLALYARVANTAGGSWTLSGTALGIVALTLVTGVSIALTYVDAVIGDAYQGGNSGAGDLFRWMAGGQWSARFIPLFVGVGVARLLSAVSLWTGIWRSERFPPWVAVSFGLAFVLAVVSAPLITMIGALLLIVSGTVMARGA